MIQISNWCNIPFETITECFNLSFSDYIIPFNVSEQYLKERWHIARVDYNQSVAIFHSGKMVAFMAIGIGLDQNGALTAHNAATGVVPEFRGKGYVSLMYKNVIPNWKAVGVMQSTLEVIDQNVIAIKAYKNMGYRISAALLCFKGQGEPLNNYLNPLLNFTCNQNIDFKTPAHWHTPHFTWEYQTRQLIQSNQLIQLCIQNNLKTRAWIICHQTSGQIMQLSYHDLSALESLILYYCRRFPVQKLLNIEDNEVMLAKLLYSLGWTTPVNQYLMTLDLTR